MVDGSYGIGAAAFLAFDGKEGWNTENAFFSLPEEVRTEVENRRDEIESEEDLQKIIQECRLKR